MIFARKKIVTKALFALLLLMILSLLPSCVLRQAIHPKEEIITSLESEESKPERSYSYVTDYLRHFGLPDFDAAKVKWAERVFFTYYNYDHGTDLSFDYENGEVLPLAAAVTRYFLNEYYDVIELTDKEAVTTAVIDSYVKVSADPYAIYRVPEASDGFQSDMSGTYAGIGVAVEYNHANETVMVSTVYPDSPAELAGMEVGDLIYAVDGILISDIGFLNIVSKIRGEIGTSVTITVLRGGIEIDLAVTRATITKRSIEYRMLDDGIGYIQITTFKDNTDEQFCAAVDALIAEGAVGLVFDLRSNTGGYLDTVVNMLSYLLPTGKTILSYQYKNDIKHTIVAHADKSPSGEAFDSTIDLPMAVVTNAYTASAAEIFAAVIRDYAKSGELEGITVGTRTYGKGIMQSTVLHGDGSSITLTVAYYDPPSGINYHGVGITPDIIDENAQTQLDTALTEIKKLTMCSATLREHVFSEYSSNGDATCASDGTKSAKCIYCSYTDTKTDTGTRLPHKFGEYVSNNDVTFTKDGTMSAVCSGCGEIDKVIDVGSHENKLDLVNAAISESLLVGEAKFATVSDFLVYWGFPTYNTAKVKWAESIFKTYYNFDHGTDLSYDYRTDDVLPLAAAVAAQFLDEYLETTNTDDSDELTNAILDSYIDLCGDKYAIYRPPVAAGEFETDMSGKFGGIGVMVEYDHQAETVMISTVFDGSPAEIAGILTGDYIYAVNGVTLEEIGYLNAVYKIRGEIGTSVQITLIRDGEPITVTAIRGEVVETSVSYEILDDGIAYVKITTFNDNTDEQFKQVMDELLTLSVRGIVFDLRNNTGGYLDSVVNMLSYILPTGKLIVSYQYKYNKNGASVERLSHDDSYGIGEPTDSVIDLPMVVITNGYTASAGEIFASVIRDYAAAGELCATLVGEKTFGKGIMQGSFIYYSDGSSLTVTTAYYNPPSGVNYHDIGIIPDVPVEQVGDGDLQLDIAIIELELLVN